MSYVKVLEVCWKTFENKQHHEEQVAQVTGQGDNWGKVRAGKNPKKRSIISQCRVQFI